MATESQALPDNTAQAPENPKNKDHLPALDMDDFDINSNEDEVVLPAENELIAKKMDARRKIEMYWEKKRLQEQLGEFSEIDFDF